MKCSNELKTMARATGLCDEWFSAWKKNSTLSELIEKFVKGQDFCIKHNFPSLEYCRETFDKEKLRKLHVYLDTECSDDIKYATYVILGNSNVEMRSDSYDSSTIFVRHNAKLKIRVTRHSYVNIRLYDNAEVDIETDNNSSKATILCKSGNVKITTKGENIKIKKYEIR